MTEFREEDMVIVYRDPRELKAYEGNARDHPESQVRAIRASIDEFGFRNPVLLKDDEATIGAGHGRQLAALLDPPLERVPTITLRGLSEEQWKAYVIADNRLAEGATWNYATLKLELAGLHTAGFNLALTGFSLEGVTKLALGKASAGDSPKLAERFGIVPFSVLNAREGWWQDRKRSWLALGIKSEIGRGENLLRMSDTILEPDPEKRAAAKPETASLKGGLAFGTTIHPYDKTGEKRNARAEGATPPGALYRPETPAKDPQFYNQKRRVEEALGRELDIDEFRERFYQPPELSGASAGTSIFDPVVCELAYRWWSPPKASVLDPFAGGSVRGVVAAKLGRHYTGIDLREEQVVANRLQLAEICPSEGTGRWLCGDSLEVLPTLEEEFDFLFSCPPYADLERYSDDERDLSTMDYDDFLIAYRKIIGEACAKLRKDSLACFVVGDIRDKDGAYRGFHRHTIEAFEDAGLALYNHAILVTAAGSLPMRAGKQFQSSRKLGKTHQDILVFLKGDSKRAVKKLGPCEFGEIDEGLSDEIQPPAASPAKAEETKYGEKLLTLGGEV